MGDKPAASTTQNTSDLIKSLGALPDLVKLITSQIAPTEFAKFGATSAVSPGYANLQTELYDTAGRRLNTIGNEINAGNQAANAAADASTLRGPGLEAVQATDAAQRMLDPEFYATRSAAGGAINDRINKGLSGGEQSDIERALNRFNSMNGTLDVPSATTTTANALNYGKAGRTALDTALTQANTFLAAGSRSGIDAFKTGTGKTTGSNTGNAQFLGVTPAGNEASVLGSNLLGQAGTYANTAAGINANRAGTGEKVLAGLPDY